MTDHEKAAELERWKRGNAQLKNRIHMLGFTETNVEQNHIGALMQFLVGAGVITDEQALDFALSWEKELHDTLSTLEYRAKAAARSAQTRRLLRP